MLVVCLLLSCFLNLQHSLNEYCIFINKQASLSHSHITQNTDFVSIYLRKCKRLKTENFVIFEIFFFTCKFKIFIIAVSFVMLSFL